MTRGVFALVEKVETINRYLFLIFAYDLSYRNAMNFKVTITLPGISLATTMDSWYTRGVLAFKFTRNKFFIHVASNLKIPY